MVIFYQDGNMYKEAIDWQVFHDENNVIFQTITKITQIFMENISDWLHLEYSVWIKKHRLIGSLWRNDVNF